MESFKKLNKLNGIINERYSQRVIALIRERYSLCDELSRIRQREEKPDEFAEYNAYVEACKAKAKEEYGIEEEKP